MATLALTDCQVYSDGVDLTTDTNSLTGNVTADDLDSTTFGGGGFRSRVAGLKDADVSLNGYYQGDTIDSAIFDNVGTAKTAFTCSPTGDENEVAYLMQQTEFSYELGGNVGDIIAANASVMSQGGVGVVRGRLLAAKQSVTGATSTTGYQLGTVGAAESVYTTVHVFTAGTTADVIVESDDNSGFSSATTRSTTTVTAVGGTWVTPVSGAISDDYWRIRFASVTGTFSIAVAVAIA